MTSNEKISKQELTPEDVKNISLVYMHDGYKSLCKLRNNIIIDLENKMFRESQLLEEFMGVKWARQVLLLEQNEVKNKYHQSIKPKSNGKTIPNHEDFEEVPDGVPISG